MAHSYNNLLVHVLFSTKNREKRLSAEIRKNLFPVPFSLFFCGRHMTSRCVIIRPPDEKSNKCVAQLLMGLGPQRSMKADCAASWRALSA